MTMRKIAVTLDERTLDRLDQLVKRRVFPSRSGAVQAAVHEKLARLDHSRLAAECAKLDYAFEKSMAEVGVSEDVSQWPEYHAMSQLDRSQ